MTRHRWFKVPFLFLGLGFYFSRTLWLPHIPGNYPVLAVVFLVLGLTAYAFMPKSALGKLSRRRMMEGAILALAATHTLSASHPYQIFQYAPYPIFLVWVYAGYQARQLLVLLCVDLVFRATLSGNGFNMSAVSSSLLLSIWTFLALFFRYKELQKRKGVTNRLNLYETEADELKKGAGSVETLLRTDERRHVHVASMIRERERTFQSLVDVLFKTLKPHTCALYLYDPLEHRFNLKQHETESAHFSTKAALNVAGIFLAVHKEKGQIHQRSSNGPIRGLSYYEGFEDVHCVLAVPIRHRETMMGVVILDRLQSDLFTPEEVGVVHQVVEQVRSAIENAESLHAYFALKEELSHFYEAATLLNRSLKVDEVLDTLLTSAEKISPYDLGMVVLFDSSNRQNRIAAEAGADGSGWLGRTFACAPKRGLVSWVVENQTPLHYGDYRTRKGKAVLFHKLLRVPPVYDSVLLLPLHLQGESLGALLLASRKQNQFSKNERKMLEVISMQAATSLKNAHMVGALEKLATTDGLTGLCNHRTFQEVLASELERAGRHPAPVSLLLIDIDYFKKFNDEYGHPVGDFVLREISGVLRRAVRKVETVARYGGEEFAIILVNTPPSGALQMAQRIVREVAASRFHYQGLTLRVTLSIGAATFTEDATTREELIECADRALYESKNRGRNRATRYHRSLGKLDPIEKETDLIDSMEEEARRSIEH